VTQAATETRHASSVAIGENAVLIQGASGAGKSDLALRLIDRGAILVSDDYTVVQRRERQLWAVSAPNIAGKIEVRNLGILNTPHVSDIPVRLVVALSNETERFPFEEKAETILGIDVPLVTLAAFESSTPIKVEMALKRVLTS
jgi:serine kinase of HPr protein (carbohydrate metabolism regulator)